MTQARNAACSATRASPEKPATPAARLASAMKPIQSTCALASQQTSKRDQTSVDEAGAPKTRRGLQKDLKFIQSWNALEVLADVARRYGGEQQLDPALEQPRLQLLKDACATGDLFYVVLHQVFCTWTAKPLEIRGLFQNDDHLFSLAEHGLRTLSAILKDNSNMRPDLLHCFANFPAPFSNMRRFPPYSDSLNAVVKFLFSMATSWTELMKKHAAYGFPLLMDELLRLLHMHSEVLQLIVFRASRRTAGVPDGPVGTQMESLFKEDQDFHRSADGSFMPKAQDPAYPNYKGNLVQRYKE
ncbi:uncharacterized protein B0I36DRAFT_355858 [Microdochium trichocladiopsis]|uniref:Uncharacterized protein n=1 Tax=Microdochium trichocladiopsis TaxID=1682393 RepID=A0A9P9BHU7_9PEZI|nr:uncharacterized protein B0I36DRAFT_355858 [Microdochium trichocladiopsis]KAH7012445.1 hypothetical protein B0I36DRAFT_355858 [Microdochium trichocladiopsis]